MNAKAYGPWTTEEKSQLLAGLERFGVSDLPSVAAAIPSRTKTEVAAMIANYEKEAIAEASQLFNADIPIDLWLKILLKHTEYTSPCIVARVFKYIKLFEANSQNCDPENEDDVDEIVDVKQCYEILADLSAGLPPKGGSKNMDTFFIHALKETAKEINRDVASKKTALDFLKKFSLTPLNVSNTYSRRPRVTSSDSILNPLKAPTDIYRNINSRLDES